jgi:starch synthase
MAKKLRILSVCSEVTPYATTGGLGDVCAALPGALAERGHQVDVIMPAYQTLKLASAATEALGDPLAIHMAGATVAGRLLEAKIGKRWRLLLVDQPEYFGRESLYVDPATGRDYADNAARFAFFCKAVIEWLARRLERVVGRAGHAVHDSQRRI